ncbi:MAG: hypothetical protein HC872_05790 [Gammaproteobacteria bacterium]|nr:hypothetical protein [Gammaproteobacteria bacterium]
MIALLFAAAATQAQVAFPAAAEDIGPHCFAAGTSAEALGQRYPLDKTAAQLGSEGSALRDQLVTHAALHRSYLARLQGQDSPLRSQVIAFLTGLGLMNADSQMQWSVAGAQEVGSHLERCTDWVVSRPPVIPAVPEARQAALDHCSVVMIAAQQLGNYKGNRSAPIGALVSRALTHSRDMLAEAQQRAIINPQELRARTAPPNGDLLEPGLDLLMGLKLANLPAQPSLDARSLRLLDERLQVCHGRLGLQMPLQ